MNNLKNDKIVILRDAAPIRIKYIERVDGMYKQKKRDVRPPEILYINILCSLYNIYIHRFRY